MLCHQKAGGLGRRWRIRVCGPSRYILRSAVRPTYLQCPLPDLMHSRRSSFEGEAPPERQRARRLDRRSLKLGESSRLQPLIESIDHRDMEAYHLHYNLEEVWIQCIKEEMDQLHIGCRMHL